MTNLLQIHPIASVRVVSFSGGKSLHAKLTQHGIHPGDYLHVLRVAPLGGPVLVECSGREIALGRGVAEKIIVEPDA